MAVGQAAIIKNLQQNVENIGVGFFDFVEQNDAVGLAPNFFGQLAAVIIAHITGWRTDQLADRMRLHEFGHVQPNHGIFAFKHGFGDSFDQLGLADTGRSDKDERCRLVLFPESRPIPANGAGQRRNSLMLSDQALMQTVFQIQKLVGLGFADALHGNAGPHLHNLGDIFGCDSDGNILHFQLLQFILGPKQPRAKLGLFFIKLDVVGAAGYAALQFILFFF